MPKSFVLPVEDIEVPLPPKDMGTTGFDVQPQATPAPMAPPADEMPVFSEYPGEESYTPPPLVNAPEDKAVNDPVRAYLESKTAGVADPKLLQAQQEEKFQNTLSGIGRSLGAPGDAAVRGAAAFAGAIGGHGFNLGAPGSGVAPMAPQGDSSPVKQYLQARQAQHQDTQDELARAKTAMDLQKLRDGKDPESLEYKKYLLALEEAKRRRDQGDRGLGVREKDQETSAGRLDETKRFHDYQERIGWARLNQQQKNYALAQYKAGLMEQRLGQADEKMENAAAKGVIPGFRFPSGLDPIVARGFNDARGAAMLADSSFEKLSDLVKSGTFSRLSPVDQERALIDVYASEVKPQLNTAQKGGIFTGSRADLINHAMADPNNFMSILKDSLGNVSEIKIDAFRKILRDSVAERAKAMGGEPISDVYGSEPGEITSARPGRPGSKEFSQRATGKRSNPATGKTASSDKGEEMVEVISPKGETVRVKKSRLNAALKAGGRLK